MEERYLSLAEACEVLGKSERTLYRWIKSGKLKAYKPGRDYEIPESAIREMRERSEVYPKGAEPALDLGPPVLDLSNEQFEVLVREADESGLSEMMDDVGRYLPQRGEERPSRRSVVAIHRCVFIARERKARAAAELEKLEKLQIA